MVTIVSLYKQLFGKKAPTDGSIIDMAEHGRAGGVSSQQGFKYTNKVKESTLVAVNSGDANITYVGYAAPGASTGDSVWLIIEVDETSGMVVNLADGDDNYDNEWDERESLSYS